MAVPKRAQVANRNSNKYRDKVASLNCIKQFPDCPEEPNEKDCKTCPYYK